jgi:phospholipid/cholesterol/gamma-HCH transport system substrate-binding protein
MDGSKAELKVGLTVILAVVVFIGSILWIKGIQFGREYHEFGVWFPNVGSLEIGDPVSVSGVRRGKVKTIALSHGGVEVGLLIANDVIVRADAVISLKNVGLMGERFVDIETGISDELWPSDSIPRGLYETGIPEVMGAMGQVTMEMRELVQAVRATIGSDESLQRLVTVSENLERLSEQTAAMVETNRHGVGQALDDLRIAARDLRETMSANKTTVTTAANRFDSASVKLNIFADKLDTLSGDVRRVVDNIANGEGSLARMINDDQLVRRWEAAAGNIDELVADIRANPQKYLHVTVRIF